jgi:DNA-directed RNA polymerase specialized sigma24 family protein
MKHRKTKSSRLDLAIEATRSLWRQRFIEFEQESNTEARNVHSEIECLPLSQKSDRFYSRFLPLIEKLATVFTETYRRNFKMALANPQECSADPHEWALNQLQVGVVPVFEWIQDWFVLACDGENRHVRPVVSIPAVPGQTISTPIPTGSQPTFDTKSWRAPAWLFVISPLMGCGPLKATNVPKTDSDERLSGPHTRLLLKWMRRMFLRKLVMEIGTARNEETAAAGAVAAHNEHDHTNSPSKRASKSTPKGFDGLGQEWMDMSRYKADLTDKQWMAFALKHAYGLGPAQISSRMGIHRKTVDEHLEAAEKKLNQLYSNEKRKVKSSKDPSD